MSQLATGPRARSALLAALLVLACPMAARAGTTTIIPAEALGNGLASLGDVDFSNAGLSPASIGVLPGGTVTWSPLAYRRPLQFSDGAGTQAGITGPSRTFTDPGIYPYVAGETDGGFPGKVYVAGPTARLRGDQLRAPDPRVRLDASATTFVAVSPNLQALYDFDADGDGVFDVSGANPIASFRYPGEGRYTARLRVTDDSGFVSETTATIEVNRDAIPPDGDKTAPKLAAAALVPVTRRSLRRGKRLVLGTPSETVTALVTLLRGKQVIAKGSASGGPDTTLSVRLRSTKAGARAIRKSRTIVLSVVLTDGSGNTTTVRRGLRLRSP